MSSPLVSHSASTPKKGIFGRPILLGCLGTLALVAIGATWLFTAGKTVVSNKVRESIAAKIEESGLPPEQQAALKVELDRLTDGFQDGKISMEMLIKILEDINQSPAMAIVRYYQANGDPLQRSTITQAQREAAMKTIHRFIFGIFEEKIPESAVEELIDPFILERGKKKNYDDVTFRTDIADEELFDALDKAKAYADAANIPSKDLSPDIASEVREIVDRILAGRK